MALRIHGDSAEIENDVEEAVTIEQAAALISSAFTYEALEHRSNDLDSLLITEALSQARWHAERALKQMRERAAKQ